jgi:hypothetical protein
MCIRFCFGSWELRSSTQYSVLSTPKNQRTTPLYAESRLASGAHPSNIAKGGQPGAGNPLTKQIEEFTNVYSFLFGCMRSGFPTLSQIARKDGAPRLVVVPGRVKSAVRPPAGRHGRGFASCSLSSRISVRILSTLSCVWMLRC